MKNYIMLSPNFPTNYRTFARGLKSAGARALGIGDEAFELLHQELRENLTEYYRVSNLHHFDEVKAAISYFQNKYGKISGLDSHSEYWLEMEAALREAFDIPGLRPENMNILRYKSGMKKVYESLGFNVAKGAIVKDFSTSKDFCDLNGYPVIVKPDNGVGAISTYKLENESDLGQFFSHLKFPDTTYVMEQYVEGKIETFDGLADEDGNLLFCTSHVYRDNVMEVVQGKLNVGFYSTREIPEKLEDMGRKCVKAFGIKNRFFHLEFFKVGANEYVPLEVNVRPPGGLVIDMFNFACDFDIFHIWANLVVKGVNTHEYKRKYFVQFISVRNYYNFLHTHRDIIDRYHDYILLREEVPKAYSASMGDFVYLSRCETLEKIEEIWKYTTAI
ncbi:MAG: ATP-grasp domain-containing protein [Fusobacteria bacterium]|nr:ATP-grasp domain-containing protein [Fusobacteriota bacterium]